MRSLEKGEQQVVGSEEVEEEGLTKCYDVRFQNPCSLLVSGGSQSGKTTHVMNLLRNAETVFRDPRCMQNVIYYYREWQPKFDTFKKENIVKPTYWPCCATRYLS